jgi:hypothetical protein
VRQPVAFRVESRAPACPDPAPLAFLSRSLAQQAAKPLALRPGRPPRKAPPDVPHPFGKYFASSGLTALEPVSVGPASPPILDLAYPPLKVSHVCGQEVDITSFEFVFVKTFDEFTIIHFLSYHF